MNKTIPTYSISAKFSLLIPVLCPWSQRVNKSMYPFIVRNRLPCFIAVAEMVLGASSSIKLTVLCG